MLCNFQKIQNMYFTFFKKFENSFAKCEMRRINSNPVYFQKYYATWYHLARWISLSPYWTSYKNKSKETNHTVYIWIDYVNERGTPNKGCHKPVLKCFYSSQFSVKNRSWDTTTENSENYKHRICWLAVKS